MANPLLNDMFLLTDIFTDDPRFRPTHPTRFYGGDPLQAGAVATAEESQAALEFEAPDSSGGRHPQRLLTNGT